jgi:hypothetical protein
VAEYPSTLRRDHPPEVSLTLLAVLCWCRLTELTDSLVDLFIDLVRAINTRAVRRVDREQIAEFRRVGDKESVLFKLADAGGFERFVVDDARAGYGDPFLTGPPHLPVAPGRPRVGHGFGAVVVDPTDVGLVA